MASEFMAPTGGDSHQILHDFESFVIFLYGLGSPSQSNFLRAAILDMLDTRQVAPWTGPVCWSHLDWLELE